MQTQDMQTQVYGGTLTVQSCIRCGLVFGIDSSHDAELRRTHKTFVCPHGHSQHYTGESDADKVARLARDLAAARDREDTLRRENEKRYRLQRAAERKTRTLKKRVAAGVCPCCTRTFQNLARHMKTQHHGVVSE
ncbi:MAG: hypothetical protein ACRD52_00550 [Candidatus Acidiferrales bacterium]